MAKFKITYQGSNLSGREPEEVDADRYDDEGDWIDFKRDTSAGYDQVLRVKGSSVKRIERVPD